MELRAHRAKVVPGLGKLPVQAFGERLDAPAQFIEVGGRCQGRLDVASKRTDGRTCCKQALDVFELALVRLSLARRPLREDSHLSVLLEPAHEPLPVDAGEVAVGVGDRARSGEQVAAERGEVLAACGRHVREQPPRAPAELGEAGLASAQSVESVADALRPTDGRAYQLSELRLATEERALGDLGLQRWEVGEGTLSGDLVQVFRAQEPLQSMLAQGAKRDSSGLDDCNEVVRRLREQNLAAVGHGADPSAPVHVEPEVTIVAEIGSPV